MAAAPPYRPIVGTLVYLWDRATDTVLLVRRDARPDDDHLGKVNGLGGKLESGEDVLGCLRREVAEEAGLDLVGPRLRGTISWPGFGPDGADWLGFVFVADAWTGTPPTHNAEGTLFWAPRRRLLDACDGAPDAAAELPMWEGDRHFLPLVFDDDPRPFWGVMPYADGRPTDWRFERL